MKSLVVQTFIALGGCHIVMKMPFHVLHHLFNQVALGHGLELERTAALSLLSRHKNTVFYPDRLYLGVKIVSEPLHLGFPTNSSTGSSAWCDICKS